MKKVPQELQLCFLKSLDLIEIVFAQTNQPTLLPGVHISQLIDIVKCIPVILFISSAQPECAFIFPLNKASQPKSLAGYPDVFRPVPQPTL